MAKFEAIKNGTNELKEIVYKEIIEYNIDLEQIEITKIAFGIILINHSCGKMANKILWYIFRFSNLLLTNLFILKNWFQQKKISIKLKNIHMFVIMFCANVLHHIKCFDPRTSPTWDIPITTSLPSCIEE